MAETNETPAYLVLTLRSCDDLNGQRFTMAGPVGGLPGLSAVITMAYDERVAGLAPYSRVSVQVDGTQRIFSLFDLQPAPAATEPEIILRPHRPASEWSGSGALGEHRMTFKAPPSLEKDLQTLRKFLDRAATTQPVAAGAGSRFNPN